MSTELRVLKHAKTYIDSLSQGVDPLNRRPVPGGSVLSQDKLKKCFAYVSGILQKVIDGEVNMAVDLRVLKHANNYMNALSRGVDPLSKRPSPGDGTLNQVNLKKCFAYVSGVLQKVIEDKEALPAGAPSAGAAPAPLYAPRGTGSAAPSGPAAGPDPAALLAEAGFPDCVAVLEGTPSLTQTRQNIAKHLDAAGLVQPTVNAYHEWLTRENILLPPAEEDSPWTVTEHGRALGFSQAEERIGKDLTWTLCTPDAQRLLAENLTEIFRIMQSHLDRLRAALDPGTAARAASSEEPITLNALVKLCNGTLPAELPRKFLFKDVTEWLEKDGVLEKRIDRPGNTSYAPTAKGSDLGLSSKESDWHTVIYNKDAQRYVIAHLPEILDSMREIRKSRRPAFFVPAGLQVAFSADAQSFTAFSAQVNEALNACGGVPLIRGAIRTWLIQEGYLERVRCADGKTRYLPGNEGEAIGLQASEAGNRIFIELTEPAQRFIVSQLDSIGAMQNNL